MDTTGCCVDFSALGKMISSMGMGKLRRLLGRARVVVVAVAVAVIVGVVDPGGLVVSDGREREPELERGRCSGSLAIAGIVVVSVSPVTTGRETLCDRLELVLGGWPVAWRTWPGALSSSGTESDVVEIPDSILFVTSLASFPRVLDELGDTEDT